MGGTSGKASLLGFGEVGSSPPSPLLRSTGFWCGFASFSFFFLNHWESLVRLCFLSRRRQGNAVEAEEIPSRLLEGSEGLHLKALGKRQGLCGHCRGRAPCWIP